MADKNPNPNPGPKKGEIPMGRVVGSKPAKPAAPARPRPVAGPADAAPVGEFDVELVAIPCPPPTRPRLPRDQRSLFDLDRRDFIMMGAGVMGSLTAVILGLAVAKGLQRKPDDETPESPKPPQN